MWLELWWDRNTAILSNALLARQLRLQMPWDGAGWYILTVMAGMEGR